MTSGVKQALPQLAIPKTGIEGKAISGRKGGADFTVALGKLGDKTHTSGSREAAPTRQDTDLRSGWPRFANRLGASDDQASAALGKPSVSTPDEAKPEAVETEARTGRDDAASDLREPEQQAVPSVTPTDSEASAPSEKAPTTAAALAPTTRQPATDRSASPGGTLATAVPGSNKDKQADGGNGTAEPDSARDSSRSPSFVPMGRGQQAEPIRFEPVTRPVAERAQQSLDKDNAGADALPGKDTAPAPRITVVSHQNIPAPNASTAVILVETIAASDLLEPAAAKFSFDAMRAAASSASAQSLKIQLHPAELGMVTATLRFAGEQLSIELKVENQEAYRRLSADSDIIVGSLRDLGYDIDRVTVVQASAPAPGAKADASMSMSPSQGRSAEQFGQGANGENAGSGGRPSGEDRTARQGGQQGSALSQKDAAGGVYI